MLNLIPNSQSRANKFAPQSPISNFLIRLIHRHYTYTIPDTQITLHIHYNRLADRTHVSFALPAYILRLERARLNHSSHGHYWLN